MNVREAETQALVRLAPDWHYAFPPKQVRRLFLDGGEDGGVHLASEPIESEPAPRRPR